MEKFKKIIGNVVAVIMIITSLFMVMNKNNVQADGWVFSKEKPKDTDSVTYKFQEDVAKYEVTTQVIKDISYKEEYEKKGWKNVEEYTYTLIRYEKKNIDTLDNYAEEYRKEWVDAYRKTT